MAGRDNALPGHTGRASLKTLLRAPFPKALLLGLVIGLAGTIISLSPFGLALEENVGLDQLFMLRGQRPAPTDVVIISIDKESARDLELAKEPVKWPRSLHAKLVDRLAARGARVIGFDVLFKEQRTAEENEIFARALNRANNVVLFQYLDKQVIETAGQSITADDQTFIEKLVPPIPLLAESAVALAPFALPKVPAKVSQVWMFKPSAGDAPTLPAVMFQLYALQAYPALLSMITQIDPDSATLLPASAQSFIDERSAPIYMVKLRTLFQNNPSLPDRLIARINSANDIDNRDKILLRALIKLHSGNESQYLNYYGPARSLTTIPFSKIINLPEKPAGSYPDQDFSGKAVFVGLSEPVQLERVDTFYTPFSQPNGVDISGIEIGATAFANLLEDMAVQPLTIFALIILLLCWGLLMGLCGYLLPTALSITSYTLLSAAYLGGSYYLFASSALWFPLVIPLLLQMPVALFASTFWKYLDTNRERKKIREAFGYYLPDNIVDDIAHNLSLGNTSHEINLGTCLATDAEKYTSLSENMAPGELGHLMNRYYESLFTPVKQHKGFVSDVIGDAMMAIWTTPQSEQLHRKQACLAALEMIHAINAFNEQPNHPVLPTRIGVHSGELLLGNIGAVNHYEYRAVGDTVNTASRIQGLNKQLGTYLLVSEDVISGFDDLLTRKLGEFLLAGKSKPVVIHELLNQLEHATDSQLTLCKAFSQALQLFNNRSWELAREKFNQIIDDYDQDGPSIYYRDLCQTFLSDPPESGWDKVITITKK